MKYITLYKILKLSFYKKRMFLAIINNYKEKIFNNIYNKGEFAI